MSPNKPVADGSTLITSLNKAPTPEAVTIPKTALATVTAGPYSQTARVQLDPDATITLFTSRLMQALKSKPIFLVMQTSPELEGTRRVIVRLT